MTVLLWLGFLSAEMCLYRFPSCVSRVSACRRCSPKGCPIPSCLACLSFSHHPSGEQQRGLDEARAKPRKQAWPPEPCDGDHQCKTPPCDTRLCLCWVSKLFDQLAALQSFSQEAMRKPSLDQTLRSRVQILLASILHRCSFDNLSKYHAALAKDSTPPLWRSRQTYLSALPLQYPRNSSSVRAALMASIHSIPPWV